MPGTTGTGGVRQRYDPAAAGDRAVVGKGGRPFAVVDHHHLRWVP